MRYLKHVSRLLLVAVAAALALFAMPASAVTDGELDGNNHPAVVLVLMEVDGAPAFRCSGTLIAPKFVLTAGHCAGAPDEFSGMRVFTESDVQAGIGITNDFPFAGENAVEAVRWAAHPLFPNAPFFVHDVGMIELENPVSLDAGEYGTLPAVDSLDVLKTQRGHQDRAFTAVGYGLQQSFPTPASFLASNTRTRYVAHPQLIQINGGIVGDFSLLLSNNTSTGGTCFGDSGGPNFLGGDQSRVVAGVTSFGLNGNCGGTGGVFRVDRQNVLDFISGFISSAAS
jgi:secreted trypsin-like serine protease